MKANEATSDCGSATRPALPAPGTGCATLGYWPMMMLVGLLATATAIAFGPPGPAQRVAFSDRTVRAAITYRVSHDRDHDVGGGAASPSISSGTIVFDVAGQRESIPLSKLWSIQTTRINIAEHPPVDGCGVMKTLSHVGNYLVVEAELSQKGCLPLVAFVDLSSGAAVESVTIDHIWNHRFDPKPVHLRSTFVRVTRVDRADAPLYQPIGTSHAGHKTYVIVHAIDTNGHQASFSYGPSDFFEAAPQSIAQPAVGSMISIETTSEENTIAGQIPTLFEGERALVFGVADEQRSSALQTP